MSTNLRAARMRSEKVLKTFLVLVTSTRNWELH